MKKLVSSLILQASSSIFIVAFLSYPLHAAAQTLPGGHGSSQQLSDKLPDLAFYQLGMSPSGSIIYQVVNSGKASTGVPFVVEIHVNGSRKDIIRHEPLPAMSLQAVESKLARLSECKPAVVQVTVDPNNHVNELDKKNNNRSAQLTPPCPKAP